MNHKDVFCIPSCVSITTKGYYTRSAFIMLECSFILLRSQKYKISNNWLGVKHKELGLGLMMFLIFLDVPYSLN